MLLLNDLRNTQEMKAPSSLDHDYKWVLFPYQENDLLLLIVHEPPKPSWNVLVSYGNSLDWNPPQEELDPLEGLSLSRAAEIYSNLSEERGDKVTAAGFVGWVIATISIRIKHKLMDVNIEEDPDYPFIKRFNHEDYNDQGLHAVANALTGYFDTLFSQSKVH